MDLNVKCKTIKLQEENIDLNLCDLQFGDTFRYNTKCMISKRKTNAKLDLIKVKNFCSAKDTDMRKKRQASH